MLPKIVWEIPKLGTINLHASLLPNYRGAAPINWVIINGETQTGVTTFFINEEIDKGNIILSKKIEINNNITAAQLHNSLIVIGKNLMTKTIELFIKSDGNEINTIKQLNNSLKSAPKLSKELSKINWSDSIIKINAKIHGLSPLLSNNDLLKDVSICPSAWFEIHDEKEVKRIKVQKSEIVEIKNKNAKIDTDNSTYLNINFNNKALSIKNLQMQGKNPMNIKQFLQGNKIKDSFKLID
jgi:methionyl-tRNA formyltransferase